MSTLPPIPQIPGFTVTIAKGTGFHSGRLRYRVVCEACGGEAHEATTGPEAMARMHRCNPQVLA